MFTGLSGYGAANGRLNPVRKTKRGERRNNKEMNKKILASIFVIGILALAMGYGTISYYSDKEESTGNVFQSGTIDLTLSGTIPFTFYDIKPSEDLDPVTVQFENIGQNPGYLYNKITYIENDKAGNVVNLNADDFAALIYVEAVTYQHWTYWEAADGNPAHWGWGSIHDDLPNWLDMDTYFGNKDGFVSLYEIKLAGWIPYDTNTPEKPLIAGDAGKWVITFHMADSLESWPGGALKFNVEDNWPQADGISMTWTAVLKQTSGPPA
jgi:predicted ribosomally synthesized peptide with SipW-like signal peptide